jgi:hypothetical protein
MPSARRRRSWARLDLRACSGRRVRSSPLPRATANFSISGTYDLDTDSLMQVIGKDQERKFVKFTIPIYVDDTEYPTQMIVIDKKGEKSLYIWKRKE